MERLPRVTVVVSFLDAERFLAEAIASVVAQTFEGWELVLVDDGSSDSSSEIARRSETEFPGRVKVLEHFNHHNRGLAASRNLALRHAAGECIAVLDSDDVWLPTKLERQVAMMVSHPEAAMVSGANEYWRSWSTDAAGRQLDYVEKQGVPSNRVYLPPTLLKIWLGGACSPCPSDWFFRKQPILNLGGFEESFIGC